MPKEILKVDSFEGGINSKRQARDVEDNESPVIVDTNVDTIGKISLSGGSVPYISEASPINIKEPGYGLMITNTDYDIVSNPNSDDSETTTGLMGGSYFHPEGLGIGGKFSLNNLRLYEFSENPGIEAIFKLYDPPELETDLGNTPKLLIRENENETWTELTDGLDLYVNPDNVTGPIRPLFEKINGAFRIQDTNFQNNNNFTKWFGVIDDTKFMGPKNINFDDRYAPSWSSVRAWLYTHAYPSSPYIVDRGISQELNGEHFSIIQSWEDILSGDISDYASTIDEAVDLAETDINVTTGTGSTFSAGDLLIFAHVDGLEYDFENDEFIDPYFVGTHELVIVDSVSSDVLTVTRAFSGGQQYKFAQGDLVFKIGSFNGQWDGGVHDDIFGPKNWGYMQTSSNSVSSTMIPFSAIANDFSISTTYDDTNPSLVADNATVSNATQYDADADTGWGRATDGVTGWWNEFDGVQFMYEFVDEAATGTTFLLGHRYDFYISAIYDQAPGSALSQESALKKITPGNSGPLRRNSNLYATLTVKWTGTNEDGTYNANKPCNSTSDNTANSEATDTSNPLYNKSLHINPRVTGVRIYCKDSTENTDPKLLLEAWFDQEGGVRRQDASKWQPWCPINYGDSSNVKLSYYRLGAKSDYFTAVDSPHYLNLYKITGAHVSDTSSDTSQEEAFFFEGPPVGVGYRDENNHDGTRLENIKYKTSATVGGVRFVGNVMMPGNSFGQGAQNRVYGDRMLQCSVSGAVDSFPANNWIDVASDDGDEITHLHAYNDNLLQFKHNVLYVISVFNEKNISPTVIGTYKHKGVSKNYHVTDIEGGVAWINKFGAFIYDGSAVTNILYEKISKNEWNWSEYKSIGYDAISRKLIILNDINSGSTVDGWSYFIDTGAWTKLSDKFSVAGLKSNFQTNNEGNLIFTTYNSASAFDNRVNGLVFQKTGDITTGEHMISCASDTPLDQNGNNFSFNDYVSENGKVLNITNTGISQSDAITLNAKFTHVYVRSDWNFVGDNLNKLIVRLNIEESHLSRGDYLYINPSSSIYVTDSLNTKREVENMEGVWEIEEVSFAADGNITDGEGLTDFPNWFLIKKHTNLISSGPGHSLVKLGGNESNLMLLEDTLLELTDLSGNANPITVWETLRQNRYNSLNLVNTHLIPKHNYFDGNYYIKQVIDDGKGVIVSKDYGEARYGYNDETGYQFKYTRLYQNFLNQLLPESTPTIVQTNADYYPGFIFSNFQVFDRNSVGSKFFEIRTKELDFEKPGSNKHIHKVYITYECNQSLPVVKVVGIVKTEDGTFAIYPNIDKSKYYGVNYIDLLSDIQINSNLQDGDIYSLSSTESGEHVASIVFNDPDKLLKKAKSFQVILINSTKSIIDENMQYVSNSSQDVLESAIPAGGGGLIETSPNFVLNDINIVYKEKRVK